MASDEKWYFTKEQLENTPSRQYGIDAQKELIYRQQAAYFIQEMGQKLRVTQLCINTASVYMHRFYVFHSFTHFPWSSIAAASLFLAAKVEEQPRKLEHVIRWHNICKNPRDVAFDVNSERYQQQSQDLVFNENVLLQTLGFDVAIDHPHAHVVRCCQLVRASKDLAQTSYFMASTSLHLTTMCLQYRPTVVACFCIHLACKWSNWEIPLSNERREWFSYVDRTVTTDLLQQLTEEFLAIFGRCPSRLKEKIMAIGDGANLNRQLGHPPPSASESDSRKQPPSAESKDSHHRAHHSDKAEDHKHRQRMPHDAGTSSSNSAGGSSSSSGTSGASASQQQREREYREKKERERLAHQHKLQQQQQYGKAPAGPHGHHRPPVDPKLKPHARPNPVPPGRNEHREVPRDSFRESSRDSTDNKDVAPSRDLQVRGDKDLIDKRAYPVKPSSDMNSSSLSFPEHFSADKRSELVRSRPSSDPKALAHKHDSRRHASDEQKHIKQENDNRKHSMPQQQSAQAPPNWFDYNKAAMYEKNSNAHSKPLQANSGLHSNASVKSPFPPEVVSQKSVPKSKPEAHNGTSASSNGSYGFSLSDEVKSETPAKEVPLKKPSMFSPTENFNTSSSMSASQQGMPAFMQQPASSVAKESKPVELLPSLSSASAHTNPIPISQPIVNGIETNPTLISNLLKEAPSVPHLPTISGTLPDELLATDDAKDGELAHKDKKKKSKEKHKHKEKSREEKEKKRKHKDKDKEKHKGKARDKEKVSPSGDEAASQPIKITISKDKIQTSEPAPSPSGGLKIKIPKDKIKTDIIEPPSAAAAAVPAPGIKIKISKEAISMGAGGGPASATTAALPAAEPGKKREREKAAAGDAPPHKVSKYSRQQHVAGEKQNGRSSFGKVGEEEALALHNSRYMDAANKYAGKGT